MNPLTLLISLLFSGIGFAAWRYGRRMSSIRHLLLGAALIGYSWLIEDPLVSAGVGSGLTVLLVWPKS